MRKILNIIMSLLLVFPLIGQSSLSDEELIALANKVRALEVSDSLKTVEIEKYKELTNKYEEQIYLDSLIIEQQVKQIELLKQNNEFYEKQVKLVKPKWYESKYIWYLYGFSTVAVSSWVVGNIK